MAGDGQTFSPSTKMVQKVIRNEQVKGRFRFIYSCLDIWAPGLWTTFRISRGKQLSQQISLWISKFHSNITALLTLFQPGGRGWNPPPRGFSLAIALKCQPIDFKLSDFLRFTIETQCDKKIKSIACQGATWSLFCQKHFASPHIFHYIYIELSSSTFSVFWHLYLVLIG